MYKREHDIPERPLCGFWPARKHWFLGANPESPLTPITGVAPCGALVVYWLCGQRGKSHGAAAVIDAAAEFVRGRGCG